MPNWRRAHVPGGSFFFSVVTDRRARFRQMPLHDRFWGSMIRHCQLKWSFTINALVLLPDHLHAIWSLPPGDEAYSKRWGWIKKEFTKASRLGPQTHLLLASTSTKVGLRTQPTVTGRS